MQRPDYWPPPFLPRFAARRRAALRAKNGGDVNNGILSMTCVGVIFAYIVYINKKFVYINKYNQIRVYNNNINKFW